jgi:uncharacterized membrane protein
MDLGQEEILTVSGGMVEWASDMMTGFGIVGGTMLAVAALPEAALVGVGLGLSVGGATLAGIAGGAYIGSGIREAGY